MNPQEFIDDPDVQFMQCLPFVVGSLESFLPWRVDSTRYCVQPFRHVRHWYFWRRVEYIGPELRLTHEQLRAIGEAKRVWRLPDRA